MFFKGFIYDPSSGEITDHSSYYDFINQIREHAELEIDLESPPSEDEIYLWVQFSVSENQNELERLTTPCFRINKILIREDYYKPNPKNKDDWGFNGCVLIDESILSKLYPNRAPGSLYITAMSNEDLSDDNSDTDDFFELVLDEEDMKYSSKPEFDCSLTANHLIISLKKLQDVLDSKKPSHLIKQDGQKEALATICFYLPEAVRFKLVQFAALNFLHFKDDLQHQLSKSYHSWSKWRVYIRSWRVLCEHLDKAAQRGYKQPFLSGIAINIYHNGVANLPDFNNSSVINVIDTYIKNENAQSIQKDVLDDLNINYPEIYSCNDGIFPLQKDREKMFSYAMSRLSTDTIAHSKNEAKKCADRGDFEGALKKYLFALELCKSSMFWEKTECELTLSYNVAFVYYHLKKYSDAIQYLKPALELSSSIYGSEDIKTTKTQKLLDACSEKMNALVITKTVANSL